jgi:hypothetical protein
MDQIPDRVILPEGWSGEIYQKWAFPVEVIQWWRRHVREEGDAGIFVSDGWLEHQWNAFGERGSLFVVVLKKEGKTKAIFPCCIKLELDNGLNKRIIASLTNAHTPHYDFIVESDVQQTALSCFIKVLQQTVPDADGLFEYMPTAGQNVITFVRELRHARVPIHLSRQPWAPWMQVSGNWEEYQNTLPGRLRSTLRRCRKKAEQKGKLEFSVIQESENLLEVLDSLFEVEYRSWKGKQGTAIKCQANVQYLYQHLAYWAMRENHLLLFILRLNETPIAASFCVSAGKTVFLLKPGYDESFSNFSPGSLLQHEVLKYLFSRPDIRIYNFLGACDPWKMEWTTILGEQVAIRFYPKSIKGWCRYLIEYGWKDFLKKFRFARYVKDWMDLEKSRGKSVADVSLRR